MGDVQTTKQNGIKSNKNKRKKKGYTKSKTKDMDDKNEYDDDDKDVKNIDVHYEKGQKKKRKVGKLKMKKPTKKYKNKKTKVGKQKLTEDESWMKQSNLKKPTHTVSESIQMLSASSLVSTKASEFEQDEEEVFDLSTMDLDVDIDQLNTDDHETRISIKKNPKMKTQSSMFDEDYDVDADDNQ